jgi:hypothetical protein
MLQRQNGVCLICDRPEFRMGVHGEVCRLVIDHDHRHDYAHRANQVSCKECQRGLLCHACNVTLGHLGDSIERIEAMIDYLST